MSISLEASLKLLNFFISPVRTFVIEIAVPAGPVRFCDNLSQISGDTSASISLNLETLNFPLRIRSVFKALHTALASTRICLERSV